MQTAAQHLDDRTVVATDDRQRRGVAIDEQQAGALVSDGLAGGLRQGACGVQFGDQDNVFDAARGEGIAYRGCRGTVGPRHADRRENVAALGGTLLRAQDRRDELFGAHLICCAFAGPQVERVVVDDGTVSLGALDQHHMHRLRCQRHTQYDVHGPLQNVC